jgi:hypothetical protein
MKTRRTFLVGTLFGGAATGLAGSLTFGQPQELPRKPQPIQLPPPETPDEPMPPKRMPEEDYQDMRKKVERLYQLATELEEEVDKMDATKVLSLDLVKKQKRLRNWHVRLRNARRDRTEANRTTA